MYARLINCSCMKNNSQSPSNDDEQTEKKAGEKLLHRLHNCAPW